MKNPFRSEAEAYRFVLGTVAYFVAIVIADVVGGRWWGLAVFVVLSLFALWWFFRRETREQPPATTPRSRQPSIVLTQSPSASASLRDAATRPTACPSMTSPTSKGATYVRIPVMRPRM